MSSEHNRPWTPGPWVYLRDQTGEAYIHQGDRFLGANGQIVGEACGPTDSKKDANGIVQAAAPELYEAAEVGLLVMKAYARTKKAEFQVSRDVAKFAVACTFDGDIARVEAILAKANPTQNGGGDDN